MSDADSDDGSTNSEAHEQEAQVDLLKQAILNGDSVESIRSILETTDIHINALVAIIRLAITEDADGEVIRALIEHEPETARVPVDEGTFLLHFACFHDSPIHIIRLLIQMNPDSLGVPSQAFDGMFPLHCACCCYSPIDTIRLIIFHRPESIRDVDFVGKLPLHVALAHKASDEIILHLLECYPDGARVEDYVRSLPLNYAYYSLPVIQKLVELFPEGVSIAGDFGDFPLHDACVEGASFEVIQFLTQQYPTAIQLSGFNGRLPLHCELMQPRMSRNNDSALQVVRLLIDLFPGAAQSPDFSGMLPIHYACECNSSCAVVRLLMDSYHGDENHHKGLNVTDNNGGVPLHFAASGEFGPTSIAAMKLLLDRFPQGVRVADDNGMLPLHRACTVRLGDILPIVQVLLEADPYTILQSRHDGKTPLQLAFHYQHRQTIECRRFLLEKQDEALASLQGAFAPTVAFYNLPDLVVVGVWSFVLRKPWRPTQDEVNAPRRL